VQHGVDAVLGQDRTQVGDPTGGLADEDVGEPGADRPGPGPAQLREGLDRVALPVGGGPVRQGRGADRGDPVKRVYDVTLVGDDEPIPFADRPDARALRAEPDPRRFLLGYAATGRGMVERLGPLLRVLVAGAWAGDPELTAFVDMVNGERLTGAAMMVQHLVELDALREGVTVEEAEDAVWTLNSVEVWSLLVEQRGWSGDRYGDWVGRAMADAVLPYPGPGQDPV